MAADLVAVSYVTLVFTLIWCAGLAASVYAIIEIRRRVRLWRGTVTAALGPNATCSFGPTPGIASLGESDFETFTVLGLSDIVVRAVYSRETLVLDFRPINIATVSTESVETFLHAVRHDHDKPGSTRTKSLKPPDEPTVLKFLRKRYRGFDALSFMILSTIFCCLLLVYSTFFAGAGVGVTHLNCLSYMDPRLAAMAVPENLQRPVHIFWLKHVIFYSILCITFIYVHYQLMGSVMVGTGAIFLASLFAASFLLAVSTSAVASGGVFILVSVLIIGVWIGFVWLHRSLLAVSARWACASADPSLVTTVHTYVDLYYLIVVCAITTYLVLSSLSGEGFNLLGDFVSILLKCILEIVVLPPIIVLMWKIHFSVNDAITGVVLGRLREIFVRSIEPSASDSGHALLSSIAASSSSQAASNPANTQPGPPIPQRPTELSKPGGSGATAKFTSIRMPAIPGIIRATPGKSKTPASSSTDTSVKPK